MIEAFFTSLFASMAHSGLKRMFRDNLGKKLTRAYDIWVQNVPRDLAFQPEALLSWTDQEAPPASYRVIQETLAAKRVPEEDAWTALFVERWQFVIAHNPNPKQPLFDPRREKEILPLFADLGHRLYLACYEDQKLFQTTMAQLAPSIAGSLTEIEKKQNRHTKLLEDVHRAVVDREHHPENHPPRPVPTLGEMKTAKQAVKEEIEVSEPQPVYRDQGIREISQALEDAERQLEQASIEGRSTIEIRESILDLRRRLREGGRRQPGEILDDRYKLIDVLGKGGFAEVWKAWDRTKRRLVAVKIMHGQFTGDKTRKERFFRGARKMRELRHPAVVDVFDEQCEDEGFPFFVMAYQAGGNLHDRVLQGKLDEAAVLAVIRTIGEALVYAHQHDLVHRDIKPGNILLDGQGRACLTDFDLVKAADSTGGTRTRTGLGTFVYAAPELMAEAKDAGVAADIYGLGMTTLFALYGKD
nr:serine/threonine-protein kinase [Acidobacteriota bacterium]